MSNPAQPLSHQVAQRLMLGFEGTRPCDALQAFLAMGLGGVIFFRRNVEPPADQPPLTPPDIAHLLASIRQAADAAGVAPPLLALDQEGGLVERLPHTLFPSLISPMSVASALRNEPSNEFCAEVYDLQAFYLNLLGFTMNLFPTLDVYTEPGNPVIGVRAFADTPDAVWRFASVALERFATRHVLAVGKHFPGHGGGSIDSHQALPTLPLQEAELAVFRRAIAAGLPAMMVSHGYYPQVQEAAGEGRRPATLSPRIIQGLLRQELGFEGLILSDDMAMGALAEWGDPAECAIAALEAGVDMLLYRDCGPREQAVHQAICAALESGRLSMAAHQASLQRIDQARARVAWVQPQPQQAAQVMSPAAIEAVSEFVATRAIQLLLQALPEAARQWLPLNPEALIWLIAPDRAAIPHYAPDAATSGDLLPWLEADGLSPVVSVTYAPSEPIPLPGQCPEGPPDVIVFVTYDPAQHPTQVACYADLRARFAHSALLLIQAGGPCPPSLMPEAAMRLDVCCYRPATLKALALALSREPTPPATRPSAQKPVQDPDEDDIEYELEDDAGY